MFSIGVGQECIHSISIARRVVNQKVSQTFASTIGHIYYIIIMSYPTILVFRVNSLPAIEKGKGCIGLYSLTYAVRCHTMPTSLQCLMLGSNPCMFCLSSRKVLRRGFALYDLLTRPASWY